MDKIAFRTQNELVEAILQEREIELLGEGFRAPNLMRLLRPLLGKSNTGAVPSKSSGYIWPIPAGELIVNKACVQNPGY